MADDPEAVDAPPALPALKLVEPEVNKDDPWRDDVLERKEIAERLTSIVRGQEAPFVISIDGRWGTGKTFLLKRWAQDLRNQDTPWEAIYFNAWEDDFNDDPLLAIIGQLSEYFDEGPLREIARGVAGALGHVLVKRVTGASPDDLTPDSLLDDYREGLRTKNAVKDRLKQLGEKVRDDTGQPLVFIIDELDRCRPTFALELLERVKHIFDVDNIVFVLGINRAELVKSLESVYGDIDAGTYLRRFFDMEFVLPDADPTRFSHHLLTQYGIPEQFQALSETAGGRGRVSEFRTLSQYLPVLLGNMGLSPRDMDYCVRLISLTLRELEGRYPLHPALFVVLVALKVTRPTLYRRFVEGTARAGEVIDYLDSLTPAGVGGTQHLLISSGDEMERTAAAIYAADGAATVQAQLQALMLGKEPEQPEYLSRRHTRLESEDSGQLMRIRGLVQDYTNDTNHYGPSIGHLAELIDLYSDFVRPH